MLCEIEEIRFSMIPKPFYVITFQKAEKTQPLQEHVTQAPLCDFQWNVNQGKHLVVGKRGRMKGQVREEGRKDVESESQRIKAEERVNEANDYGEGIITLRLENGKPIELVENQTEEDHLEDDQQLEEKSAIMLENQKLEEEKQVQALKRVAGGQGGDLKQKINQKTLPKFMRMYFIFFHIKFVVFLGLFFFIFFLKNRKLNVLKKYVDFFITFNQEQAELQNIVGQVKKLHALSLMEDVSIFEEEHSRSFLTFSIERIQSLEKRLVEISLDIGDGEIEEHYLKKTILVELQGGVQQYELTKAVKHVLTNAFLVQQLPLSEIAKGGEEVSFLYRNIMNHLWKSLREFNQVQLEKIGLFARFEPSLIVLQFCLVSLFIISFLCLYAFSLKMRRYSFEILSVFIEIQNKVIKKYLRNCETFCGNLQTQEDENFFLDVENLRQPTEEQEEQFGFSRKRRKSLIEKISFNKIIFVKFIFCFLVIACTKFFSIFHFKDQMDSMKGIIKELNSTSTFSNEYYFANNAQFVFLLAPQLPLMQQTAHQFNAGSFQQLFYLEHDIAKNQLENIQHHSGSFNDYSNQLLMHSLCSLDSRISTGDFNVYPDAFNQPDPNLCADWSEDGQTQDFVKDGLTIGLSQYEHNLKIIWEQLEKAKEDSDYSFFDNEYCNGRGNSQFKSCYFNHPLFVLNEEFQNNYLTYFAQIWMDLLSDDFVNHYSNNILQTQFIILISIFAFIILCYFVFFLQYFSEQK